MCIRDRSQAEQVPERLLEAATWLFTRQGYGKTTMEAIAKRARASTKTVYSRYANKEEVLRAVVRRMFDRSVGPGADSAPLASDDPREVLMALGRSFAALSAGPVTAGVNRLIMSEAFQLPELADLFADLHARATGIVRAQLERWRDAGVLGHVPEPEVAAMLFVEMAASLPRLWALLGRPMSQEETERTVATAVELFLNGCGPRRAG